MELPVFEAEQGEVGGDAGDEGSHAGEAADDAGGGDGGAAEYVVEGHAEMEQLGHCGGHVVDGAFDVAGVKVTRDGVDGEAGGEAFASFGEAEAAEAVAEVEQDAAGAGVGDAGLEFTAGVAEGGTVAGVGVGEDVAGAEVVEDFGDVGRGVADVDHELEFVVVAEFAGDAEELGAVASVHVGADLDLDTEEAVGVRGDDVGGGFHAGAGVAYGVGGGVAVGGVEVDEAEYAGLGAVDDVAAEAAGVVVGEAAGIDPGSDAGAGGDGVGVDAGDGAAAEVDVGVEVDEAGDDVEAGSVDDFAGLAGVEAGGDGGYLAVADGDVGAGGKAACGVADVAMADEQVPGAIGVLGRTESGGGGGGDELTAGEHGAGILSPPGVRRGRVRRKGANLRRRRRVWLRRAGGRLASVVRLVPVTVGFCGSCDGSRFWFGPRRGRLHTGSSSP